MNETWFKQIVKDEYQKIFEEEVDSYKKQYKLFSKAIDAFVRSKKTQTNLAEFVDRSQNHWWNWFDGDEADLQLK